MENDCIVIEGLPCKSFGFGMSGCFCWGRGISYLCERSLEREGTGDACRWGADDGDGYCGEGGDVVGCCG